MPRDLAALIKGDDKVDTDTDNAPAKPEGLMFGETAASNSKRDDLHPYTQTLTLNDVDSCVVLEDLAFPPNERASRAKVSLLLSLPPTLPLCPSSSTILFLSLSL